MSPAHAHARMVERGELRHDEAQTELVAALDDLHARLVARPASGDGLLAGVRRWFRGAPEAEPEQGLYIWGGVGRGKTLLVDLFFDSLPFEDKLRIHFHAFMQRVHDDLKQHRQQRDPLARVADGLARQARILCFDEFHVSDIADAMLLGRLLEALFARGIVLVATSNIVPTDLYLGGLQRERFLPAIALIERHTRVFHLASSTDYRLRALTRAQVYHHPLDAGAEEAMSGCFRELAPEGRAQAGVLSILGRTVATRGQGHGIAWFDFDVLCGSARAASDYLELARQFHTVLVSGVPHMDDTSNDATLRFIHLVDTFYDRNVNLVASAAAPPAELYRGQRLTERFARTRSRLQEMASHDYLARAHLP